eukprot:gene25745-biopygen10543
MRRFRTRSAQRSCGSILLPQPEAKKKVPDPCTRSGTTRCIILGATPPCGRPQVPHPTQRLHMSPGRPRQRARCWAGSILTLRGNGTLHMFPGGVKKAY